MEGCVSMISEMVVCGKNNMGKIMNEEKDWDRNVEGDTVESLADCVSSEEVVQALKGMKNSYIWTCR